MRTTINLPDELVKEAMKASGCKTRTDLFTLALENIITREKVTQIKKYRGKIDLECDLDKLRDRK